MNIITDTGRLLLRQFTIDDAPLIYKLNSDPDVIRYTRDPVRDIDHAREIIEKIILPQYSLYGLGRWAVIIKNTNDFIGWCGLKYRPELSETDLGFRFKKDSWGKGYAKEAALACIQYGFEKLNLSRIVGRAEPANIASWKVLEFCKMIFIGLEKVDGYSVKTYEIVNSGTKPGDTKEKSF